MRNFITGIILLTSMSSFAQTYNGYGEESEAGEEVCSITVTRQAEDTIELKLFALGQEVRTVVQDAPEINFKVNTESPSLPVANIRVNGLIKDGMPVSFDIQTREKVYDGSKNVIIEDGMHCSFKN